MRDFFNLYQDHSSSPLNPESTRNDLSRGSAGHRTGSSMGRLYLSWNNAEKSRQTAWLCDGTGQVLMGCKTSLVSLANVVIDNQLALDYLLAEEDRVYTVTIIYFIEFLLLSSSYQFGVLCLFSLKIRIWQHLSFSSLSENIITHKNNDLGHNFLLICFKKPSFGNFEILPRFTFSPVTFLVCLFLISWVFLLH